VGVTDSGGVATVQMFSFCACGDSSEIGAVEISLSAKKNCFAEAGGFKDRRVLRKCARHPARSTRKPVPKHPAHPPPRKLSVPRLRHSEPRCRPRSAARRATRRRAARRAAARRGAPPRGTFKPATAVATAAIKEPRVQPPLLQEQQPPQPGRPGPGVCRAPDPGRRRAQNVALSAWLFDRPAVSFHNGLARPAADPCVLSSLKSLAASCGPDGGRARRPSEASHLASPRTAAGLGLAARAAPLGAPVL
jgi:hypothetical protein